MTLLNKIESLKKMFSGGKADPQDLHVIDSWYEQAKRLFLLNSLKGHDGVKFVLEVLGGEVAQINNSLQNKYSKDLSDYNRDRLLDKRDNAQKLLNLFIHTEKELAEIEEMVDNNTIKIN